MYLAVRMLLDIECRAVARALESEHIGYAGESAEKAYGGTRTFSAAIRYL